MAISKPAHEFLKNNLMKLIQPRIAELVAQREASIKKFESNYEKMVQIKGLLSQLDLSDQNEPISTVMESCVTHCLDITSFRIRMIVEGDNPFDSNFALQKEKAIAKINFFYWKQLLSNNPSLIELFNLNITFIKQLKNDFLDVTLLGKSYSSKEVETPEQLAKLFNKANQDIAFTEDNIERIVNHFLSFEVVNHLIAETSDKIKQELQEIGEPTNFNLIPRFDNNLVCSFNQQSMLPLINVVRLINLSKTQDFIDLIQVERETEENPSKYIEFGNVKISVSKRILGKPRKVKIKLNSIANWLL